MPIDMHSHYYGGLVEDLRKRTHRPYVAADELGRDVLHAMTASTVMSEGYTDLGARLTYLNSAGIRTQLMTFPGALGVDAEDADQVAPRSARSTIASPTCAGRREDVSSGLRGCRSATSHARLPS